MSDYSKEEMSKAILDCYDLSMSVNLLKQFPLLTKLAGFEYKFDSFKDWNYARQCTIRYINYFYSRGLTCIKAEFPQWDKRKVKCAQLAGFAFDEESGRFQKSVEEILYCKNPQTNQMIISFIRHNYSDKYSALVVLREQYYGTLRESIAASPKDSIVLISLTEKLEKLELDLLNEDKAPDLSMALIQTIEADNLGLRPEEVAERIRDGKKPIDFEIYS